jgi:uncharacterized protein (TIGR03067 family)
MRIMSVLLVFVLGLIVVAAQADTETIQGTWSVVKATKKGKEAPEEEIKQVRLIFKGNNVTVNDGKRDEEATFKLDPAKKPKEIDITPGGGNADQAVPGIYEMTGDDLKICFSRPGGERPTNFDATPESKNSLLILKRMK